MRSASTSGLRSPVVAVTEPRAGAPAGYVFIDADLFRCEPEYDLGVLLRDWTRRCSAPTIPSD